MIRFNIQKLQKQVEELRGARLTLKEISEKSGCDKNALSRLVNHPDIIPSAAVIDKLAQYFFFTFKELHQQIRRSRELMKLHASFDIEHWPWRDEKLLMNRILCDLIVVYPDTPEYWNESVKLVEQNSPTENPELFWHLYEKGV